MEEVILFNSRKDMLKAFDKANPLMISFAGSKYYLKRKDEQVFLYQTKCPHSGYSLGQAAINPFFELVCPWHGYRFHLKTGKESQQRCGELFAKQAFWNEQGQLLVEL